MIQIVMKPDYDAGIVDKESLYRVICNGEDIGLRVRGLRAAHAEEKLMEIFRLDLKGKVVDYDLEAYRKNKEEAKSIQEDMVGEEGAGSCTICGEAVENQRDPRRVEKEIPEGGRRHPTRFTAEGAMHEGKDETRPYLPGLSAQEMEV